MRKPDFFIVGAPKCGTTSMHRYMSQHPDIFMAQGKEPIYFGSDLKHDWKVSQEQYFDLFRDADREQRIGEKSVWYMHSETAAAEIKAFDANADIIIMLRNPVDMMH